MPKIFFVVLVFMLLFITDNVAYNATPVAKSARKLRADSTAVDNRKFDDDALKRYAGDKNFKYENLPSPGLSLWSRFWQWIWHIIGDIFSKLRQNKASWFLFKTALYVFAAVFLIFIIFKLAGVNLLKLLKGESKNIDIPYGESLENIHEINFDNELEAAINNRNYRLAVRLLYLSCLKQLNDAQLINWQIEKTNTSYVNELTDTGHRQQFSTLTTQFEYVWYGDFPVDGRSFQNINTLFIDFKKSLK